jgi:hypothetical protein
MTSFSASLSFFRGELAGVFALVPFVTWPDVMAFEPTAAPAGKPRRRR